MRIEHPPPGSLRELARVLYTAYLAWRRMRDRGCGVGFLAWTLAGVPQVVVVLGLRRDAWKVVNIAQEIMGQQGGNLDVRLDG